MILNAPGFPADIIRHRARTGRDAAFPGDEAAYGSTVLGGDSEHAPFRGLDDYRIVPPVLVPSRLDRMVELGREPTFADVDLDTQIGGFSSRSPLYVSALGSTKAASSSSEVLCRQAGKVGIPLVIGENVSSMARLESGNRHSLDGMLRRISEYFDACSDDHGGIVVQQSTEDADNETWNALYAHSEIAALFKSGRMGFELKVGQGAKPGLGGLVQVDETLAAVAAHDYVTLPSRRGSTQLRASAPGTFTENILRGQLRMMSNNFPLAKTWVKFPPGRDIRDAAAIADAEGVDAMTVDGAEGGSGWAPTSTLSRSGLPLAECLRRVGPLQSPLLVSGGMWEGTRIVSCLALGASAAGLGRAALIAVDEDADCGLEAFIECLDFELRALLSSLGRYHVADISADDVWRQS